MKSCEEIYQDIQRIVKSGQSDHAVSDLEKLVTSQPDFAAGHYDLGTLHWERGDKNKAMEHYLKALELDPGSLVFCRKAADLYYTEFDNIGEAMRLYQRIVEANPHDIEALMILANLNVVENEFDTAEQFYRMILEIEPWNQDASALLEKLNRRKQSMKADQSAESRYQNSRALFQAGQIENALTELEKLTADHPELALVHNDLGVLYYQLGRKNKALTYYQEAVRLEPANPVYQKNLADFYYVELGRIEDALEIYLSVLKEEPTDIEILMAAGYICMDLDRAETAEVFCSRVLDIEPWNAEAQDMLQKITNKRV